MHTFHTRDNYIKVMMGSQIIFSVMTPFFGVKTKLLYILDKPVDASLECIDLNPASKTLFRFSCNMLCSIVVLYCISTFSDQH